MQEASEILEINISHLKLHIPQITSQLTHFYALNRDVTEYARYQ
jgi:hypothetical protein